jgi:hypothetical protein
MRFKGEENMNQEKQQQEPLWKKVHAIIADLLKEMGINEEFETFDETIEGSELPGEIPEESGMILTKSGKIYHYWLDWDPEKIAPDGSKGYYTLGENFKDPDTGEPYPLFREASPEEYKEYQEHPEEHIEYLLAKRKLNLPLTEKEKEILREYEEKWK